MSFQFSNPTTFLSQLQSLYSIADTENNTDPESSATKSAIADIYDLILAEIAVYPYTYNLEYFNVGPAAGVEASVALWADGAKKVNANVGYFAEFIREYTKEQFKFRYGADEITEAELDTKIQKASNNIALGFAADIIVRIDQNQTSHLPTIQDIAELDAGPVAALVFNDYEITGSGPNLNYAAWAGTVLFPFLGAGDVTEDWLLDTGSSAKKTLAGTYDMIVAAATAHKITNILEAWDNNDSINDTTKINNIGESATDSMLSDLRDTANEAFQEYYGLPDEGRFQIGGDLPLYAPSTSFVVDAAEYYTHPTFIVGTVSDDTLENIITTTDAPFGDDIVHAGGGHDEIMGSTGVDLIDGGVGSDALFFNAVSGMGLLVELEDAEGSFYEQRMIVKGDALLDGGLFTYAYGIENLILTNQDDTVWLNDYSLDQSWEINALGQSTGGDTLNLSMLTNGVEINGSILNSDLTLIGFEKIVGTDHDDMVILSDADLTNQFLVDGGLDTGGDTLDLSALTSGVVYDGKIIGSNITFENFENLIGTSESDKFFEISSTKNSYLGSAGNDTFIIAEKLLLDGDNYDGEYDQDTIDYSGLNGTGIYVDVTDIANGTVQAWDGSTVSGLVDDIKNIEVIKGTASNDRFSAASKDVILIGGAGSDDYVMTYDELNGWVTGTIIENPNDSGEDNIIIDEDFAGFYIFMNHSSDGVLTLSLSTNVDAPPFATKSLKIPEGIERLNGLLIPPRGASGNADNTGADTGTVTGEGAGGGNANSPIMPIEPGPDGQGSPLVLDLDNDGIELVSLEISSAYFDLENSGQANLTGWIMPDDGFLARDLNSNGKIDNITELFGTLDTDGFSILQEYDSNSDGVISALDDDFDDLLIWRDLNIDGKSQEGELQTLGDLNITSIFLDAIRTYQNIDGNIITHESTYVMNSIEHTIVDAWFAYDLTNTRTVTDYEIDLESVILPNLRGRGELQDLRIAVSMDNGSDPTSLLSQLKNINAGGDIAEALSNWNTVAESVHDLMLSWAGVDEVSPTGRGLYVDGQKIAFYEAFRGSPFSQYGQPNPLPEAGDYINAIYDHVQTVYTIQIMAQLVGSSIYERPIYNIHSGLIEGDLEILEAGIDAVELAALGSPDPVDFWARFAQFIGYTKGFNNLEPSEILLLDAAVLATGEPSLDEWQDVINVMTATYGVIIDEASDWSSFEKWYDNLVLGTSGSDNITDTNAGGRHNNEFRGGDGNDTIDASDGHDKLVGGGGNDTLIGGMGDDYMLGGAGDDIYMYESGKDTVSEVGGGGYDELHIAASTGLTTADLTDIYRYGEELMLMLSTGEFITLHGYSDSNARIEKIIFDADSSFIDLVSILEEKFYGTANVDILEIEGESYQTLTVYAYAGNDVIEVEESAGKLYGGDGYDILVGDYQDDFLYGENHDDYLAGNAGNDRLSGGNGNDALYGGDDDDDIYGGAGDDLIDGGAGNDYMEGSHNNDTYVFGRGYGQDVIYDMSTQNGSRNDKVKFTNDILTTDIVVSRGAYQDIVLRIIGETDTLTLKDQEFFSFSSAQVESVVFANGSVWNASDLRLMAIATATTSGNDTIRGFDHHDDVLQGGLGNDSMQGQDGNDTYIFGLGDGQDTISDSGGSDTLVFLAGIDPGDIGVSLGSNGAFILSITGTSDTVTLNKQEYDGFNTYRIDSVEFDDTTIWSTSDLRQKAIEGQVTSGNDTVVAFTTNDTIWGGTGNDTLKAGTGNDIYLYELGDGQDTFEDIGGIDAIHLGVGINSGHISQSRTGDDLLITISAAPSSSILIKNHYASSSKVIEKIVFSDTTELTIIPQILGTSGDDTISGTSAANLIYGLEGNDTINAGSGNDEVYGGDGDDTINGNNGHDLLYGGAGIDIISGNDDDDYIEGGDGADTIYGGNDNDTVHGGAGNDIIYGGNQADYLFGGDGDDQIYGDSSDDILSGGAGDDTINGGTNTDTVTYENSLSAVTVNILAGTATGEGNDTLVSIERAIGSLFDDHLTGGSNGNTLSGLDGNDILIGGDEDDRLEGGLGDDLYIYTYGDDEDFIEDVGGYDVLQFLGTSTLENLDFFTENHDSGAFADDVKVDFNNTTTQEVVVYNQVSATLTDRKIEEIRFFDGFSVDFTRYGTAQWVQIGNSTATQNESAATEARTILGGTNGNTITGTAYADQIHGDLGNDTIHGGNGNDWLAGGTGNDTINGDDGDDVIYGGAGTDTINGGNGNDTLVYAGSGSGVTANLSTGSATGEGTDTISNIENITGSAYADTLTGNSSVNILIGGAGADALYGGGSHDTLNGGLGADTLYGEAGADIFMFLTGQSLDAGDTIADFDLYENDKIDISDLLAAYDPLTDLITDFVEITTNGSDSVLKVDTDGGADGFVTVAIISDVTGLTDEAALVTNGHLIVV